MLAAIHANTNASFADEVERILHVRSAPMAVAQR